MYELNGIQWCGANESLVNTGTRDEGKPSKKAERLKIKINIKIDFLLINLFLFVFYSHAAKLVAM